MFDAFGRMDGATTAQSLKRFAGATVWQEEIRSAIPGMIKSLKEPNAGVRGHAQNILLILAEIAQWCEEIRIAIPRIIDALEESDSAVQDADSNQSQSENTDWLKSIQYAALDSLSKLTNIAELREDIRPAIPKIVAVLIPNPGARKAALISLSRLADTGTSSIFPSLHKRTHQNLKPIGATSAQRFPLSLRR
ncbi:hypothetical protein DFH08DRAFT_350385 [Mycena albidolilacea]|uniref:Uncharacterized protein n=1 Tax=Mycena albidolilacea TaxID=1033008 RepID=A0AAD6ZIU3_9AGAR|nr:hypothetical protein DFH08DRAFT_350385 [Mycena albidolilacea]